MSSLRPPTKTVDPFEPRVSTSSLTPSAERSPSTSASASATFRIEMCSEQRRVVVRVELQRADLRHADEPLRVERDAIAARQRGERRRPGKSVRASGAMCTQRTLVGSGGRSPGSHTSPIASSRMSAHVAVVVDRADRRRRPRDQPNRRAEPDERRQELVAVVRRAARDDPRGHAQQLQRAGAVVRPAAGRRRPVREDVATQVAEKRNHAPASIALRCTSARAHAARTNAAAKLGSEAPPHGRACGCRWRDEPVHQPGPVGYSHW